MFFGILFEFFNLFVIAPNNCLPFFPPGVRTFFFPL